MAARKGRFELAADRGTVFLDEIGDLDQASQVKLLRVLQQHTFEPVGESRSRKVDIRVVCATNADIPGMVRERTFREDLYYRINLVTLRLPPLRERRDDIPALVRHFATNYCRGERHDSPRILGRSHAASCAAPLSGQYPRTAQCGGACHDYGADGGSGVEDIDRQCENMHDEAPQVPLSSLEDIESHAVRQAIRGQWRQYVESGTVIGYNASDALSRRMENTISPGRTSMSRKKEEKGYDEAESTVLGGYDLRNFV